MVWTPPLSARVPVATTVHATLSAETSTLYWPIRPFAPEVPDRVVTDSAVREREDLESITIQCGSGATVLYHWVCQIVPASPSSAFWAAPFSPTSSWLSAVAVQALRGASVAVGVGLGVAVS